MLKVRGMGTDLSVRARLIGSLRRDRALREEVFERLYAEHAKPLLSFLTLRTGDRVLAEDLVADTFERVLRKRRMFDRRRGTEKSWIYSIALNLLRDHARRSKIERGAAERLGSERAANPATRELERVDARDVVARALGSLSPAERDALALRFGADLTLPEIAGLTGNPLTTVEGRVYGALRKLRDELEKPDL
jgi:RNA polymerase sigma factor (sigma-70 family)